MIYLIDGLTGSGKTFKVMKKIRKRWLRGEDIYTSHPLTFKSRLGDSGTIVKIRNLRLREVISFIIRKIFKLKPIQRGKIAYFEELDEIQDVRNGVIYFDEFQDVCHSRYWDELSRDFQRKLCQQRKHRLDMYATTPHIMMIDVNYRRLIHQFYRCKRIFQIGRVKSRFGLFLWKKADMDLFYSGREPIDMEYRTLPFFIHFLTRQRYNTLLEIHYKQYQILCLDLRKNDHWQKEYFIIPKSMTYETAKRLQLSLK